MASLTQARLLPLAQRYIAMSTWRSDLRDCLTATDNSITTNRIGSPRSATMIDVIDTDRQDRVIKIRNKQATGRHRHYVSKDLLREIHTPRLIGNKYLRLESLVRTNPSNIMRDDIVIRNCYREKFTLREILALKWFQPQQGNGHKTNNNQSNRSDSGSSSLPFYVMFGVFGLFRKPSTDELEEERARLSDEQKVKKMKPVEMAIAKGVLSMCDQNYERAGQLFHEALHMAQDENDEEREDLILNLIAANYFESGDFRNAEKLFIDIMKRMIAHDVAPTAPAILELSLKLASIYSRNPETAEKALKGFKFVISSLLNNLHDIVSNFDELDVRDISDEKKNELALLGWSYDWFAKHLLIMNDYSSAATMLHKAYEISTKVLGPLHDQSLILLNDIGTTLAMDDSPDEGKEFIKKAVEGAITNHSSELASFYVNLGLVYLKLRDLKEAKQYCEYSMDLAKKNPEQYNSHEIIELSQTCLTQIHRLLGSER